MSIEMSNYLDSAVTFVMQLDLLIWLKKLMLGLAISFFATTTKRTTTELPKSVQIAISKHVSKAWFKNVLKRECTSLACAEMHLKSL